MATKTDNLYVTVEAKIAEQERVKASLTDAFNASTDETAKADLQKQLSEADRKIRWYNGRKNSSKFQAKATAAATKAAEAPADEDATSTEGTTEEVPTGEAPVNPISDLS